MYLLCNHPEIVALQISFPFCTSFHLSFIRSVKKSTTYLIQQRLNVSKMDLSVQSVLFLHNYIVYHVAVLVSK